MGIALEMLGVGMITVFVILSLVVLIGNLIIRFVNQYLPEGPGKPVSSKGGSITQGTGKIAAIISAISLFTGGRGKVSRIEKL
ncbi:MAG: OadG family protein [Mangrovibacterium sp.]